MTEVLTNRTVVEAYFAAINSDRFADLAPLWHVDGELHAAGASPRIGRDAVLAHFPAVLASYVRHHDEVTRWIEAGYGTGGAGTTVTAGGAGTIVTEIRFSGELTDGGPVEFDAVDVFDLVDGVIVRLSSWYDTRAVARMVRGGTRP